MLEKNFIQQKWVKDEIYSSKVVNLKARLWRDKDLFAFMINDSIALCFGGQALKIILAEHMGRLQS